LALVVVAAGVVLLLRVAGVPVVDGVLLDVVAPVAG
jgi:hypothetical protein